jgi:hypothetical protein
VGVSRWSFRVLRLLPPEQSTARLLQLLPRARTPATRMLAVCCGCFCCCGEKRSLSHLAAVEAGPGWHALPELFVDHDQYAHDMPV